MKKRIAFLLLPLCLALFCAWGPNIVKGPLPSNNSGYIWEGTITQMLWWDVDFGITNTSDALAGVGDKIKLWQASNDALALTNSAAADNKRPYLSSGGPNGYNYVKFPSTNVATGAGLDAHTTTGKYTYIQPFAAFFVVRFNDSDAQRGLWGGSYSANTLASIEHLADESLQFWAGGYVNGGAGSVSLNTWTVVSCYWNGANSLMRTNGVLYVAGDPGDNNKSGWGLGFLAFYNSYNDFDDVSAVRFYAGTMTSNDIRHVELELGAKYGISIP